MTPEQRASVIDTEIRNTIRDFRSTVEAGHTAVLKRRQAEIILSEIDRLERASQKNSRSSRARWLSYLAAMKEAEELASAPAKIDFISDGGPWVSHNMPCPINWAKERAVFDMDRNVFFPSWEAQEEGWMTVKATGWRGKLVRWLTR